MFRRLFWLVVGIAVGVWGTGKVNRAARRFTPEGLADTMADRVADLGGRLRDLGQGGRPDGTDEPAPAHRVRRRTGRPSARWAAWGQGRPQRRKTTSYHSRRTFPHQQKEGH